MLTTIGANIGLLGKHLLGWTPRGLNFHKIVKKNSRTMMNSAITENIVWMDMEMTGLDISKDQILELACIVTDKDLKVISNDFHVFIHQPDDVLNNMNEWCTQHHQATGLTDACRTSSINLEIAQQNLLSFLKKHVPEKSSPLAGNSIYTDRLFLKTHMPMADEYLHYRIIDVSSIAELARRWNKPIALSAPKKKRNHRALDDVYESIEQLKYYKLNFLKNNN